MDKNSLEWKLELENEFRKVDQQLDDHKQLWLDDFHNGYKAEDWLFFETDDFGYYAFKNDDEDVKVYGFDHGYPNRLSVWKNYIDWQKRDDENAPDYIYEEIKKSTLLKPITSNQSSNSNNGEIFLPAKQMAVRGSIFLGIGLALLIPMAIFWGEKIGTVLVIIAPLLIVVGGAFIIFGIIKQKRNKAKQSSYSVTMKRSLANQAFDQLLTAGKDYTVIAQVEGAVLVKKEVKWAYFSENAIELNALFTITTDKGTFAFQVKDGKIFMIPTDLAESMYKFE